ncbi:hypothetical protein V9T40_005285 [Parthenolecanium corni]|uniref:AAA+ ATPase domain-containing protein n=1 Tax=Parthenolecanium corni TaxID=536013 RepID=A0AAN9TRT1_9HEMI
MKYVLHVEIVKKVGCSLSNVDLESVVLQELQALKTVRPGSCLQADTFLSESLKKCVTSIRMSEISELEFLNETSIDNVKELSIDRADLKFHQYLLEEEEIQTEEFNAGADGDSESVSVANYCVLPHVSCDGLWESLIFDNNIKESLLEYAITSMIFSQHKVDTNVICWNRVILLYGPPGTGKTSLCKALAQKLSIRLKSNYQLTEFIEVNSHSLFSKYYSESGKLVMKMFAKIKEHLEYGESLVCVLIDEIESLTRARNSCVSGGEPSDSIRVVNAILTQLDQIRKYPNVLILTTSNLKSAIDVAFVDRADLQVYIGPPSAYAIYSIFVSCLEELIRVGIITTEKSISFLPAKCVEDSDDEKDNLNNKLLSVAKLCDGLSGRILRKIPFLAYSYFSRSKNKSIENYIGALQQAISQYQSSNEKISFMHSS